MIQNQNIESNNLTSQSIERYHNHGKAFHVSWPGGKETDFSPCGVTYILPAEQVQSAPYLSIDFANLREQDIDLTIEIEFANGSKNTLNSSDSHTIQGAFYRSLMKSDYILGIKTFEVAFKTHLYEIYSTDKKLSSFKIIFDKKVCGDILIDNIYFILNTYNTVN